MKNTTSQIDMALIADRPTKGGPGDKMALRGSYKVEIICGKTGGVKHSEEFHNDITNAGKNALLDSFFRNQTQPATWYFGLVDNSGWSAFAAGDTMASHAGWTEFTSYSDSTRVAWTTVAASSQSITNTTVSTFNINGSGTLKGIFVNSVSTKGGTTGTLWSTAAFTSTVPVTSGDQLKITYTVNA
jgi:hypothetical protein